MREALRPHLDSLLDEDVLLGPPGGVARTGAAGDNLRPIAYQVCVGGVGCIRVWAVCVDINPATALK